MIDLPKVLLVEDDRSIAGALAQALKKEYDVDIASSGKLALYKVEAGFYNLIVLDLNLPDYSGVVVCQQLRDQGCKTPILILSGEAGIITKISLLDSGANDYLTKPFSLGELKARLRALERNSLQPTLGVKVAGGDLILNQHNFSVRRGQTDIRLRPKEFAVLECLMKHAGTVVSRETLTHYVWQGMSELWTNTVEVHIKCLRDKIDRPFGQPVIKTVHGRGYKLETNQALFAGKNSG